MKAIKKKSKKLSKLESYWQLFARFCLVENESGTYSELIDRVKFFNEQQKIVKKIPKSADGGNACMLLNARRVLGGRPKEMPKTLYEYRRKLAKNLYYFAIYLQDGFQILFMESQVYVIMRIAESYIRKHFAEINPDGANIEMAASMLREQLRFGSVSDELLSAVDSWRQQSPLSFCELEALLDVERMPLFTAEAIQDISTLDALQMAAKQDTSERFNWSGKDIACYLGELSEPETSQLIWKEDINMDAGKDATDGQLALAKTMDAEVHEVKPPADSRDLFDWEKEGRLDITKNHYIEGDNLRALKLLMPTYRGKIKMIYIDPPYNTGQKFVYNDKFNEETEIYERLLFAEWPKVREEVA